MSAGRPWSTRRAEFCLDRWIAEDAPDGALQAQVVRHLLALLDDPRPWWVAPVPGTRVEMYFGNVPGTNVGVLFVLVDDEEERERDIVFWSIDNL